MTAGHSPRPAGQHQHARSASSTTSTTSSNWSLLLESEISPAPWHSGSFPKRILMLACPSHLRGGEGLRVGAILNPTSVSEELRHLADLLHERRVLAALRPEHAWRGDVQYLEGGEGGAGRAHRGARTFALRQGLRIAHARATSTCAAWTRWCSTSRTWAAGTTPTWPPWGLAMQAAARQQAAVRGARSGPTPSEAWRWIGGVVQPGFESFVGLWPIWRATWADRGEYARVHQREDRLRSARRAPAGVARDCWFAETRLPW